MAKGFIRISRKLFDNDLWKNLKEPFDKRSAWVDMIQLAAWKDLEVFDGCKKIPVKRGEFLTSLRALSQRWQWSIGKTRQFLVMLEREQMIERFPTNELTRIRLCNYNAYNDLTAHEKNTKKHTKSTQKAQEEDNTRNIRLLSSEEEKTRAREDELKKKLDQMRKERDAINERYARLN